MFTNLVRTKTKFYEDQALAFITFGGFGRYVLSLLHAEFERLGIPEDKARFLAFDTQKTHPDHLDPDREKEYFVLLKGFDTGAYIKSKENMALEYAVSHIPTDLLCDIAFRGRNIPAAGFIVFHKHDDQLIQRRAMELMDELRSKSQEKKLKLILVSGMGESVSSGMSVPFLYRLQRYLLENQIRVDVFLATSEGHIGSRHIQEEKLERNCVASAMLWEYAMAGRNGLTYPARGYLRGLSMFEGKIADRIYVFSGGSFEPFLKYPAIASIMAQCICTLSLTGLESYMSHRRATCFYHTFERQWEGSRGELHPTSLVTMSVAGLKADCLPQLYHLYRVRRFIEEITASLDPTEKKSVSGKVRSWFLRNHLNENEILAEFGIELPVRSSEFIKQGSSMDPETLYDILCQKITLLNRRTANALEKKKNRDVLALLIENVIDQLKRSGASISTTPRQYMKGALLFYEKAASWLSQKLARISKSILKLEADRFAQTQQRTLNQLLGKLKSGLDNHEDVATSLVSLERLIMEIATDIQIKHIDKYNLLLLHNIYQTLYDAVASSIEKQKHLLYKYNKLLTKMDRCTANIIRISRSAFTYHHAKFESLAHWMMKKLYEDSDQISTEHILQQLGALMAAETMASEQKLKELLLKITRPDIQALSDRIEDLYCKAPRVVDYLKTCIDHFFLTVGLDQDRFPGPASSQLYIVICTKKFFETYRETLFEGFYHIESGTPFNVMISRHEEGFPFNAMGYMQRINQKYKKLRLLGKSRYGHIINEFDVKLPLLDA